MGKILSIIGGIIAILLGLIGIIGWFGSLLVVLKGTVPGFLILGGVIALFTGISEIKDEMQRKQEEAKEKPEEKKD